MPSLIRTASLTHYADVARSVGLDPVRMLREFRLPARALRDPELKVPLDAVRRLLEASATRSKTEAFGLLMAEARRLSNLGPLGLLIREQPTLRLAIDAFVRHGHQLNESLFLAVEEIGSTVVLREELLAGQAGSVRQATELAIGVACRTIRAFSGPDWRPRCVCFTHDPPADAKVHRRVFRTRIEFRHDFNGLVLSASELDAPNPDADPQLAQMARRLLDSERNRDPDSFPDQVRELIVGLLGTGTCTVDRVAQHLGVDRRTVHRHLQAEGQSFSAILEAVRREFAARYLEDRGRSLAEVSALLGFAAPSGFSRWYRQHFDAPPSARRGSQDLSNPRRSG